MHRLRGSILVGNTQPRPRRAQPQFQGLDQPALCHIDREQKARDEKKHPELEQKVAQIAARQSVTVTATSVADPTKYASSFITILPYNPSGLTLLSILPINSSGSRQQFTFGVADSAGAADVTWLQPFFSATFPLNTGAGGCHMIFYPTSGNPSTGVVYLDGAAGGSSWSAGSSAVGAGGIDLSNGLCTVHAGSSSISWGGINYYLTLDVQFQGTELGTEKFDYLSAGNAALPNGTDWLYFGWWY